MAFVTSCGTDRVKSDWCGSKMVASRTVSRSAKSFMAEPKKFLCFRIFKGSFLKRLLRNFQMLNLLSWRLSSIFLEINFSRQSSTRNVTVWAALTSTAAQYQGKWVVFIERCCKRHQSSLLSSLQQTTNYFVFSANGDPSFVRREDRTQHPWVIMFFVYCDRLEEDLVVAPDFC